MYLLFRGGVEPSLEEILKANDTWKRLGKDLIPLAVFIYPPKADSRVWPLTR